MTKVRATRAQLTWDEIHEIETKNKGNADVRKLIKHIRFIEHLRAQSGDMPEPQHCLCWELPLGNCPLHKESE